jgi:hypothetical protein
MTIVRLCDFCGREIPPSADRIKLLEADQREYPRKVLADYHDYCWNEVRGALRLIESVGGSLEHLPVASHQAIAAMRRRHTFPADGDAA